MAEAINSEGTHSALSTNELAAERNMFAAERNMLAYERTLMAWIRTAISMISFGFTIYKFFQELSKTPEGQERILTPRLVGMIMILFGLLSLILAHVQHQIVVKKLKKAYPSVQKSLSSLISFLVLVFGLVLFLGALFRQ